jgi:hypothetical protein
MKMMVTAALLALAAYVATIAIAQASDSLSLKPVLSCVFSDGTHAMLKAQSHDEEGDELFIDLGGKTNRAFLDMPDQAFVGQVKLAKCVDHVLVFALAYGPPYLKGEAIRSNPQSRAIERIYFAEKTLPRWLYASNTEMLLVIPNTGNETPKKYLIYRYETGKGQPDDATATDQLPTLESNLIPIR